MTDEAPQTAAPTTAPATPTPPLPAAPNRAPGAHRRSSPAGRGGRAPRGGRWRAGPGPGATLSVAGPVAVLGTLAVVLAACGSSGTNAGPTTSGTAAATTTTSGSGTTAAGGGGAGGSSTATVKLATTSAGKILENSSGMALYTFGPDHGGTQSVCTGACIEAWPPVTVPAGTTPTAGSGVTGTLGTSKQSDGALQVTYDGKLLYTFLSDQPGQVTGNGVAGFSVAKAATAAPTAATTTTGARGSNY